MRYQAGPIELRWALSLCACYDYQQHAVIVVGGGPRGEIEIEINDDSRLARRQERRRQVAAGARRRCCCQQAEEAQQPPKVVTTTTPKTVSSETNDANCRGSSLSHCRWKPRGAPSSRYCPAPLWAPLSCSLDCNCL